MEEQKIVEFGHFKMLVLNNLGLAISDGDAEESVFLTPEEANMLKEFLNTNLK